MMEDIRYHLHLLPQPPPRKLQRSLAPRGLGVEIGEWHECLPVAVERRYTGC